MNYRSFFNGEDNVHLHELSNTSRASALLQSVESYGVDISRLLTHWYTAGDKEKTNYEVGATMVGDIPVLAYLGLMPDSGEAISLPGEATCIEHVHRYKPLDKPYVIFHLESSEGDESLESLESNLIIKLINKFMGDTHAILLTAKTSTPCLTNITKAILRDDFYDLVGQFSLVSLLHLIADADAVVTVDSDISCLARSMKTPALLINATADYRAQTVCSHGVPLELIDGWSTPYQLCEALACLLSFSTQRPLSGIRP